MNPDQQFTVIEHDGQPALSLEVPGGRLTLALAPRTSVERATEVADYLHLVIEEVMFSEADSVAPDLERLNEEQPVSVAVDHE
jgi:hypothetical protein